MSEQPSAEKTPSEGIVPTQKNLPGAAQAEHVVEPSPPKKLSAEEQMALYEKDLKENDWGHQPC